MQVCSIPKITILSDGVISENVEINKTDAFELDERLLPLLDILRHKDSETPLSMMLYGGTGVGKTTALSWLSSQLKGWNELSQEDRAGHVRVLPVWFSPLRDHDASLILSDMLSGLLLQCLVQMVGSDPTARLAGLVEAAEQAGPLLGEMFLVELEALAHDWGVLAELQVVTHDLEQQSGKGNRAFVVVNRLLTQWMQKFDGNGEKTRIALFINDLSYSLGDAMMTVFDIIQSGVLFDDLIFVVELDLKVAQKIIQSRYQEHGYGELQSRNYLSKIFQVEYNVEPSHHLINQFYDKQVVLLNEKTNQLLNAEIQEEYRGCITSALLHLAKNNPRRIKLMLNSALMKGCVLRRQSDTDSLLFMQGVQIYLLKQWVGYCSAGSAIFYRPEVLHWFEVISKEACSPLGDYAYLKKHKTGTPGAQKGVSDEDFLPPDGLDFNWIHKWVWNLLKIPFSAEVASYSMRRSVAGSPGRAVSVTDLFAGVSARLKDAIIASVEKSEAELVIDDLLSVVHLDLSHHEFSAEDEGLLGKVQNLTRLALNNSSLKSLECLHGMQKLTSLNLTCTEVSDWSALAQLSSLTTLDLSLCTIDDLSPLKEHPALQTLILYGTAVKNLEPLRDLKTLKRLNLSHTKVMDSDLAALETLTNLKTLFLRETQVTPGRITLLKRLIHYDLDIEY